MSERWTSGVPYLKASRCGLVITLIANGAISVCNSHRQLKVFLFPLVIRL